MQEGYFKVAWSDIKNSPGWFGKCCLLGLLLLIPVFGPIVAYGYAFGWARDIAWDVHRPLPDRIFGNEDGQLYSRGFYAWVITLVAGLITTVFAAIADDNAFLNVVACALGIFLSVIALVCIMRMAIYGRLGAGFQLNRVWAMMSHDASGLLRILGMVLLVGLIAGLAWGIVFCIAMVLVVLGGIGVGAGLDWASLGSSIMSGAPGAESQVLSAMAALAPVIGIAIVLFIFLGYVLNVIQAWMTLLQARAMGYWTRQFDVAHWGGQDDPMPFEVAAANRMQAQVGAQYAAGQQPSAQYQQYQQYQQPVQAQPQPGAQAAQAGMPVAQNPYAAQQNPYVQQGYAQPAVQNPYVQQASAPAAVSQPVAQGSYMQQPPVAQPVQQAPQAQPQPAAQHSVEGQPAVQPAIKQPSALPPMQVQPAAVSVQNASSAESAVQQPVASQVPVSQDASAQPDRPTVFQTQSATPVAVVAQELAEAIGPETVAEEAAEPASPDVVPAYAGRPVEKTAKAAEVPLAPRWQKIDFGDASMEDSPNAADSSIPAYAGKAVQQAKAADVPLAPRWEKIDLDSL